MSCVGGSFDWPFVHPTEIFRTYRSTPRLMTIHDFVPSPPAESICTSRPHRPQCKGIFASWMGPKMVFSPDTPSASAEGSARMADFSRHVVEIPTFVSRITGGATKCCPTSTGFENPASRELCDASSNKSGFSCLVRFVTWYCEVCVWRNSITFTAGIKIPNQDCSVSTELTD